MLVVELPPVRDAAGLAQPGGDVGVGDLLPRPDPEHGAGVDRVVGDEREQFSHRVEVDVDLRGDHRLADDGAGRRSRRAGCGGRPPTGRTRPPMRPALAGSVRTWPGSSKHVVSQASKRRRLLSPIADRDPPQGAGFQHRAQMPLRRCPQPGQR